MAVSVTGIIINVIMLIVIVVLIVLAFMFNSELQVCEKEQSPFCYTIQCPCDAQSQPPCFGYAKMPAGNPGQWRCSNAPLSIVDGNGNLV